MEPLLTPQELAEYLKMSPRTVLRKARAGEIPATKIGRRFRFNKGKIDKWLLRQAVNRPAHILVIDNEPSIGQLFKDSLKDGVYQVTATSSSHEALGLVAEIEFDLIFLGLVMPEIDGSVIFRRIRKLDEHVPIVIMTGYSDSDLMQKHIEHGPSLVMKKPSDIDDILRAVSIFLTSHGRRRKNV
jgi:excisionase family DNA binding protein